MSSCDTCIYRDEIPAGHETCVLVDGECPEAVAIQAYEEEAA